MAIDSLHKADLLLDLIREITSEQGSDKQSNRDDQEDLLFKLMKPQAIIPDEIGQVGDVLVVRGSELEYESLT